MPRFVLIREGAEEKLVREARIPLEAELHDLLTNHPNLVPVEDLGFGRTVTVGKEAALASGYADLVLIDEFGRIALVEVKKEGNPDTRRVVAQLFDYGASMWGLDIAEFEERVLAPFRAHAGLAPTDLRTFFTESFPEEAVAEDDSEPVDPETITNERIARLSANLNAGRFTFVIAAPQIPPGVAKVLDYLNTQGLRLFGIEFHYFKEESVEVLVPRVAVAPARLVATPAQQVRGEDQPFDRDAFLSRLPENGRGSIAALLDGAIEHGGSVKSNPSGNPTIIAGRWNKAVCSVDKAGLVWLGGPSKSAPAAPVEAMQASVTNVIPGRLPGKPVRYIELPEEQQAGVSAAIYEACGEYADMV